MADLDIQTLTDSINKVLEYSRDIATFSLDQRDTWLEKGLELQRKLTDLVGKRMLASAAPDVIRANSQLSEIRQRLDDKQDALNNFVAAVQEIDDGLAILDILVGSVIT